MCAQFEHEAVKKNIEKEEERYEKLEKKLKITTHGYVSRDKALTASIHQAWTSLQVTQPPPALLPACNPCGIAFLARTAPKKFRLHG